MKISVVAPETTRYEDPDPFKTKLLLTSIGCLQLFGAHGTSIVDLEPREAQWMDYIELFVLYVCILP